MTTLTAKHFVFNFMGACILLLTLIAAFNRVVDPFWYYRDTEIAGFNAIKTKFRRYERDVKPSLLVREQPEAIILGSSFAEIGFNPDNADFTQQRRLSSMNFAFAGASWQMVQCEFAFAITHAHIKRALIGIHPEAMPLTDCAKEFANIGQISVGELLLSSRALSAAIQTIKEQKNANPSHTRAGMYFYTRGDAGVDKQFKDLFARKTKTTPRCLQTADPLFYTAEPLAEATLDLTGLQHLITIARQHQVQLTLVLYPRHAYSLELDQQCGTQATRWQAMKQIARLNAQLTGEQVAIWQFYGYNAMTTEAIGANAATYWQDPEHFNFEMGNIMLAEMFNAQQPSLGHKITTQHIDDDYREFLHNRSHYLQQHSEFQSNLQPLLK